MLNLRPEDDDEAAAEPSYRDRLSELYREQMRLSKRFDPASEAAYQEVIRQIAELTASGGDD